MILQGNYIHVLMFHGDTLPVQFWYIGLLRLCTSALRGSMSVSMVLYLVWLSYFSYHYCQMWGSLYYWGYFSLRSSWNSWVPSYPSEIITKKWAWHDFRKANFYLYLFSTFFDRVYGDYTENYPCVLKFHRYNTPSSLLVHGSITPVYFHPKRVIFPWIRFYNWYDFCTYLVTAVRCEAPVILGNPVLRSLPGTPGFQVPPTNSFGKSMGSLIVYLVASVYYL